MTAVPGFFSIIALILMLVVPVGIMAGLSVLQVYLSKRDSRWPGLILPMISFGLPLIIILGLLLYSIPGTGTTVSLEYHDLIMIQRDAQIETHEADREAYLESNEARPEAVVIYHDFHVGSPQVGTRIGVVLFIFIIFNIPTAIFLIIYAVCRRNRKKVQMINLNKMSLQDL